MDKMCMIEDCQEEAVKEVSDGNLWSLTCQEHIIEFKKFAKSNNLKFEERELPWKRKGA